MKFQEDHVRIKYPKYVYDIVDATMTMRWNGQMLKLALDKHLNQLLNRCIIQYEEVNCGEWSNYLNFHNAIAINDCSFNSIQLKRRSESFAN